MLTVLTFDHIVLNVADVEASALWYARVLGMMREDTMPPTGGAPRVSMIFGRHKINLRPLTASQEEWFTAGSPHAGSDDLCFITTLPPPRVADHLLACGVPIELGPVMKKGAMGAIRSIYVRDPDGNLVEIASYP
jgi:catechol 2,3-dioxygenase-like lactoylglutathione lyase family enzyme